MIFVLGMLKFGHFNKNIVLHGHNLGWLCISQKKPCLHAGGYMCQILDIHNLYTSALLWITTQMIHPGGH